MREPTKDEFLSVMTGWQTEAQIYAAWAKKYGGPQERVVATVLAVRDAFLDADEGGFTLAELADYTGIPEHVCRQAIKVLKVRKELRAEKEDDVYRFFLVEAR